MEGILFQTKRLITIRIAKKNDCNKGKKSQMSNAQILQQAIHVRDVPDSTIISYITLINIYESIQINMQKLVKHWRHHF